MILNPLLQKQNLINQNYVLLTWADEIFLYKILLSKKHSNNFKKKNVKFIQVFMILNPLLQKQYLINQNYLLELMKYFCIYSNKETSYYVFKKNLQNLKQTK